MVAGETPEYRCGYVQVREGHPFFGVEYLNDDEIDVEGDAEVGLTYSADCLMGEKEGWWFGFDCMHCSDAYHPEYYKANPERERDDLRHFWTLSEVERDVNKLAVRLAKVGEKLNIFNLEDVSDLPEAVKGRVGKSRSFDVPELRICDMVLELFYLKDGEKILTVDEMIVGLYRRFRVVKGRDDVLSGVESVNCDPGSEVRFVEIASDVFERETL